MKMGINPYLRKLLVTGFLFSLLMPLFAGSEPESESVILKMNRDLENWNLSRLALIQSAPESKLIEFETDGCSGGLSGTWNGFAKTFPEFKQHFSDRPPWEPCCVTHDRAYWKGEIDGGFDKRLQADKTLRQCVFDYGIENSTRLASKFNISEENILTQINLTSTLMYHAVRLGGKPCSFLPWRWGYGWPHCEILK